MTERLVILSDLHLGRTEVGSRGGTRTVERLDGVLEEGSHVLLNGDTAEFQEPDSRGRAADELGSLLGLAERRGVRLVVHAGNHDPDVSHHRFARLAAGTVLVTHGDAFHPTVAPWSPRADAMRAAWQAELAGQPVHVRNTIEGQLRAARAAGRAEHHARLHGVRKRSLLVHPWTALQIAWYWHQFPRLAAQFAQRHLPETSIVIAGHSHRPGMFIVSRDRPRPTIVLNTGAFSRPHAPHAVVVEGSTLTLVALRPDRARPSRGFVFGRAPKGQLALQAPWDVPSTGLSAAGMPAFASLDGSVRPSASDAKAAAASTAS